MRTYAKVLTGIVTIAAIVGLTVGALAYNGKSYRTVSYTTDNLTNNNSITEIAYNIADKFDVNPKAVEHEIKKINGIKDETKVSPGMLIVPYKIDPGYFSKDALNGKLLRIKHGAKKFFSGDKSLSQESIDDCCSEKAA